MTLEELIEHALLYIAYSDDDAIVMCCSRASHRAKDMAYAMRQVAREFHEENSHEWVLASVTSFDNCDEFPCRLFVTEEEPELVSTVSGPIEELERFEFANGSARVHPRALCEGRYCVIHNPSQHRMVTWPMVLRETALVERLCSHGIGHPDPDSVQWMDDRFNPGVRVWGVHGCDGCCHE